jgi:hypothetical protein
VQNGLVADVEPRHVAGRGHEVRGIDEDQRSGGDGRRDDRRVTLEVALRQFGLERECAADILHQTGADRLHMAHDPHRRAQVACRGRSKLGKHALHVGDQCRHVAAGGAGRARRAATETRRTNDGGGTGIEQHGIDRDARVFLDRLSQDLLDLRRGMLGNLARHGGDHGHLLRRDRDVRETGLTNRDGRALADERTRDGRRARARRQADPARTTEAEAAADR